MNNALINIRKKIFLTAYASEGGHIPSALSIVEVLYALYHKKIMTYDTTNPKLKNRDKLILSKGHGSLALYSVLCDIGTIDEKVLYSCAQPNSVIGLEPSTNDVDFIEASTGSLGHGLSLGVGMALANKLDNINSKVYVIVGDGEAQEGTIWEAVMSAKSLKLDNLILILDSNKLQKMDLVENTIGINTWANKFDAFGWDSHEVDGHNVEQIYNCLSTLDKNDKPHAIISNTIKGMGISFMQNSPGWHYKMPNPKQLKKIMQELDITQEELDYAKNLHQYN